MIFRVKAWHPPIEKHLPNRYPFHGEKNRKWKATTIYKDLSLPDCRDELLNKYHFELWRYVSAHYRYGLLSEALLSLTNRQRLSSQRAAVLYEIDQLGTPFADHEYPGIVANAITFGVMYQQYCEFGCDSTFDGFNIIYRHFTSRNISQSKPV